MKPQPDPLKKTKDLPVDPKAPRPPQQTQIDLERGEGEGMGQGRYEPQVDAPAPQPDQATTLTPFQKAIRPLTFAASGLASG